MKALYFENDLRKALALKVAQRFYRFAAFAPFSPLRYADVPEPGIPNPRWLKVRNRCCGLCGTDLHFMFMEISPGNFSAAVPGVARKFLGHELLGEVIEKGSDVHGFKPGDRVVMRIDWPSCFQMEIEPPCPQCAAGCYMRCENLGKVPLPVEHQGGGFSPRMVMHRTQPYLVPAALSDDAAVLLEPMACAVHGALKSPAQPGETALVIGGGTLGLLTIAALRALSPQARVFCLTRYPFQTRVAEKLGAAVIPEGVHLYARIAEAAGARHVQGRLGNEILLGGFDRIYDTVGSDATLHNALRWAKAGGAVVLCGINFNPGKVDYSPVWSQEVNLLGINCHAVEACGLNSFDLAADLLGRGCLDPSDIITHRYPIEHWREAVRTFLDKRTCQAIKIVVDLPAA
jgi:threonine dehydrogenase-like Zn-dependent dehydrogenase